MGKAAAIQIADEVDDKEQRAAQEKANAIDTEELDKKNEIFESAHNMKEVWEKSLEKQKQAFNDFLDRKNPEPAVWAKSEDQE